jgi:hypothetical protein
MAHLKELLKNLRNGVCVILTVRLCSPSLSEIEGSEALHHLVRGEAKNL